MWIGPYYTMPHLIGLPVLSAISARGSKLFLSDKVPSYRERDGRWKKYVSYE